MGKALKYKQERKEQRELEKLKKQAQKETFKNLVFFLAGLSAIFLAVTFGYQELPEKYKNMVQKEAKKEEKKSEAKSYKTGDKAYSQAPEMQIDIKKKYIAAIETNKGKFKAELYADKAPKTVNNFVVLAKDKFYDGLIFHRVIKDFMIQGGDPKGDGTSGPGYKFEDEQNDIKLERGVLAMANSGANTNGSQFFVITKDKTDWLQGKHTAFGKVIEGLDVVMNLEKVETENDKPKEEIKITKVTIEEK